MDQLWRCLCTPWYLGAAVCAKVPKHVRRLCLQHCCTQHMDKRRTCCCWRTRCCRARCCRACCCRAAAACACTGNTRPSVPVPGLHMRAQCKLLALNTPCTIRKPQHAVGTAFKPHASDKAVQRQHASDKTVQRQIACTTGELYHHRSQAQGAPATSSRMCSVTASGAASRRSAGGAAPAAQATRLPTTSLGACAACAQAPGGAQLGWKSACAAIR